MYNMYTFYLSNASDTLQSDIFVPFGFPYSNSQIDYM